MINFVRCQEAVRHLHSDPCNFESLTDGLAENDNSKPNELLNPVRKNNTCNAISVVPAVHALQILGEGENTTHRTWHRISKFEQERVISSILTKQTGPALGN